MSISISIVPLHGSLNLYGNPDPTSAYSLSGHVCISLARSRKPVRFLLKSLVLTFEGQSEFLSAFSGYVPLRLCSTTRDLAPSEPFELTNEGHEDSKEPIKWNVIFNLPVPGWLPATSAFGEANGGTRYALHATAEFININESPCNGRFAFLSSLFSSWVAKTRTAQAPRCDLTVNRLHRPPPSSPSRLSLFPMTNYAIEPQSSQTPEGQDQSASAPPVKLTMFASIPAHVSVNEHFIPLCLRVSPEPAAGVVCRRFQISDFSVELEQNEEYRARPSQAYVSKFPLPPKSNQPPNVPLLSPHSVNSIYELGFVAPLNAKTKSSRVVSLKPSKPSLSYTFTGGAETGSAPGPHPVFTLNANIPFAKMGSEKGRSEDQWWFNAPLRTSAKTPLLEVSHAMHVSVTCTYDVVQSLPSGSGGSTITHATERLHFTLSPHFVEPAPAPAPPSPSLTAVSDPSSTSSSSELLDNDNQRDRRRRARGAPPTPSSSSLSSGTGGDVRRHAAAGDPPRLSSTLPPYSQLYRPNGQRRTEWELPLPRYEPPSSGSTLF